jgi:hypothetical protein
MLKVRQAQPSDFSIVKELRNEAFLQEYGIDDNLIEDAYDAECVHLLLCKDDEPVATMRVLYHTEYAKSVFGPLPHLSTTKCGEFSRLCMPSKRLPNRQERRTAIFLLLREGNEVLRKKGFDALIILGHKGTIKTISSLGVFPYVTSEKSIVRGPLELRIYAYDVEDGARAFPRIASKL